jgi:hypothetical protein
MTEAVGSPFSPRRGRFAFGGPGTVCCDLPRAVLIAYEVCSE